MQGTRTPRVRPGIQAGVIETARCSLVWEAPSRASDENRLCSVEEFNGGTIVRASHPSKITKGGAPGPFR
jgi:hypothetical protein